ncbi:hypothetical protein SAMN05421770_1011038 [Granulicella rosea]|uniref:MetA-pathway of phenol degradation n=1 Tax=Granulicella rosea TaxID=474952 RepID=A0A239EL01_9BACT|nr:hypothetical protein [Granulicella rosea]SNS45316.1 hypothetical protein SAMN05421770_1011038 [Granulicella rosea]
MKRLVLVSVLAVQTFAAVLCSAQNLFTKWEDRVRKTSAEQPGWVVPVITPAAIVTQLIKPEFARQITTTHGETDIWGDNKGLQLIPYYKTEVDIVIPPYIEHNNPAYGNVKNLDGAGDFSMVLKYRPFTSNEQHHNYSVAVQLAASGATGSYKNGVLRNTYTPNLIVGKGYKRFDVQSALGGNLPIGNIHTIGRTIAWNTVAQYRIWKLWPEVELNSTWFHLGPNDGKNQTFVTPGLMVSKFKLRKNPKDRLSVNFGAGMQIATSPFHAYNHAIVVTTRFVF